MDEAGGAAADVSGGGADPPDPRLGRIIQERYRLLSRIAAGGMGMVYRGERVGLGRPVAIKFLNAAMAREPQTRGRFDIEARAMGRLGHPNCIAVIDFGVFDGMPFLVMDYVQGTTLRSAVDAGPLPSARAVRIARQLLSALAHAHGQGIIHRDIKPDNIVLESGSGLDDHVRVLDFGLAKLMGGEGGGLTVGFAVGTPNYMAPEQTHGGEGEVDARADLYATGVVLFEMLTGKRPFDAADVGEIFVRQIGMAPPLLRAVAPESGFSAELEAVVLRAMAKTPADRFASAAELAAALDATPEASGRLGEPTPTVIGAMAVLGVGPTSADATILQSLPPTFRPDEISTKREMIMPLPGGPSVVASAPVSGDAPAVVVDRAPTRWLWARPWRLALFSGLSSALLAGVLVALWARVREPVIRFVSVPPPVLANLGPTRSPVARPGVVAGHAAPRVLPKPASVAIVKEPEPVAAKEKPSAEASSPADQAAATARSAFADHHWSQGIAAFRLAIKLDPKRRGDKALIAPLIASLDNDKGSGERVAFLRELGSPARPYLREAARHSGSARVRARAAQILREPTRKKPFLRLL